MSETSRASEGRFVPALLHWGVSRAAHAFPQGPRRGNRIVVAFTAGAAECLPGEAVAGIATWREGHPMRAFSQYLLACPPGVSDGWVAVARVSPAGAFAHGPLWLRIPPVLDWPVWEALATREVARAALEAFDTLASRHTPTGSPAPCENARSIPSRISGLDASRAREVLSAATALTGDGMGIDDAFRAAHLL